MMQLTIESIKTNPSGKSCMVKAGGQDYFAKPNIGLSVGMVIDAETEVSEYNGKQNVWIKKYKAVNGSAAPQESAKPLGAVGTPSPAGAAPVWANFVSNQVAHAIQAGLITDPSHIKVWAAAAKQAFMELA
jgi:hypothetical protein